MTILHTLASGSSGNAALLEKDGVCLLLDAGISCRRITSALRELGRSLEDLSGILITHTHADHIAGLQTLLKRWDGPIYASEAAGRDLRRRLAGIENRLSPFAMGERFTVDGCDVDAFPTSHDAPGSAGFRVGDFGLLTDTGFVTDEAAEVLCGVPLLMLEANHDVDMLRGGPYPYFLKRRILGDEGHLSNEAAARFAVCSCRSGTEELVLAHLSRDNNTPETALCAVSAALAEAGEGPALSVAERECTGPCHQVTEGVCKR
ncbi:MULTISPECIES: MBL fold metallo-hydrolase [unclassified Oscillibacter]|uniref:MBL fold metallo-hydrolase n=1 Tax=unclassified Oscillibacter TaxID=2629304 RepID=UPI0025E0B83C|nr:MULTISPECIES: MBL fold metallo-hydrolase [unclassified Oscillibacter]